MARQRWRRACGALGEPLNAEQTARAGGTALNPAGEWMPAVIAAADIRLQQKRQHVPDAAGMIIANADPRRVSPSIGVRLRRARVH
jgi:hypothetical protein